MSDATISGAPTRDELLELLQQTETDMTLFFRGLADVPEDSRVEDDALLTPISAAFYDPSDVQGALRQRFVDWLRLYCERAKRDELPVREEVGKLSHAVRR